MIAGIGKLHGANFQQEDVYSMNRRGFVCWPMLPVNLLGKRAKSLSGSCGVKPALMALKLVGGKKDVV